MTKKFKIGDRDVGDSSPCFIIAEVAQAHDGSLGAAHAYIDAIAEAGADAVKFQTHIADAESTIEEPWRIKFSKQDASRFDYWKRMEFTEEQWQGLRDHAQEKGIVFLSSPFSLEAIDVLDRIGMPAWKVPSGEVTNITLLEAMVKTGSPVLLSSGMSSLGELEAAVQLCRSSGVDYGLFQCTTAYPCPPEKIGLNVIGELRDMFGCPAGLSDHSATVFAGLSAATLGADFLEVHVTFDKKMFGPDTSSSLTFGELEQLVNGTRFIEKMIGNPVNKNDMAEEMLPLRDLFTKSIVTKGDLSAGSVLSGGDLTFKKPGTGIPADKLKEVIGRTLKVDVSQNTILSFDQLL